MPAVRTEIEEREVTVTAHHRTLIVEDGAQPRLDLVAVITKAASIDIDAVEADHRKIGEQALEGSTDEGGGQIRGSSFHGTPAPPHAGGEQRRLHELVGLIRDLASAERHLRLGVLHERKLEHHAAFTDAALDVVGKRSVAGEPRFHLVAGLKQRLAGRLIEHGDRAYAEGDGDGAHRETTTPPQLRALTVCEPRFAQRSERDEGEERDEYRDPVVGTQRSQAEEAHDGRESANSGEQDREDIQLPGRPPERGPSIVRSPFRHAHQDRADRYDETQARNQADCLVLRIANRRDRFPIEAVLDVPEQREAVIVGREHEAGDIEPVDVALTQGTLHRPGVGTVTDRIEDRWGVVDCENTYDEHGADDG